MKKSLKIVLVSVGSFFGLLGAFYLGIVINGNCLYDFDGSYVNRDWMNNIKDEAKLNEMILPGSHNAGTYTMNHFYECQTLTVREQLEVGVRYLDLRVRQKGNDFLMYHSGMNGVEFEPILNDIADFLTGHPSETLLLDFQHFDNDSQDDVDKLIQEYLLNKDLLVKLPENRSELEYVSSLTLGQTRGKAIVFYGDHSTEYWDKDYIFARNDDSVSYTGCALDSEYDSDIQKQSSSYLIEEGFPKYYSDIQKKIEDEGYKGFFVLQGQLTDGQLIFGPYAREKTHLKNMSNYLDTLPQKEEFQLTNIVMRDFLTTEKASQILKLNQYKGFNK